MNILNMYVFSSPRQCMNNGNSVNITIFCFPIWVFPHCITHSSPTYIYRYSQISVQNSALSRGFSLDTCYYIYWSFPSGYLLFQHVILATHTLKMIEWCNYSWSQLLFSKSLISSDCTSLYPQIREAADLWLFFDLYIPCTALIR